jgi:hypothetical protein
MKWNECLPLKLAVWAVPRAVLHLLRAHCGAQGCSRFSSSFHRDTASHSQNVTNNKYVHLTSFRANARVTHSNTWFQHPTLIRRCICWKAYLKTRDSATLRCLPYQGLQSLCLHYAPRTYSVITPHWRSSWLWQDISNWNPHIHQSTGIAISENDTIRQLQVIATDLLCNVKAWI